MKPKTHERTFHPRSWPKGFWAQRLELPCLRARSHQYREGSVGTGAAPRDDALDHLALEEKRRSGNPVHPLEKPQEQSGPDGIRQISSDQDPRGQALPAKLQRIADGDLEPPVLQPPLHLQSPEGIQLEGENPAGPCSQQFHREHPSSGPDLDDLAASGIEEPEKRPAKAARDQVVLAEGLPARGGCQPHGRHSARFEATGAEPGPLAWHYPCSLPCPDADAARTVHMTDALAISPPPSVEREGLLLKQVEHELRKVLVGQDELVERLLIGLLARGHLLLEGVPGLAKTLAVKTLARTLALDFKRIQFTPDLLPADLVGTLVFDPKRGEFEPRKGPIFTNVLLADEINRAPAKVQSALLEAMEEKQVTLGDATYPLPEPFLVLGTQNPIEQEGTYPLAEAQVDRFFMKIRLRYPSREEEGRILDRMLVEREFPVSVVLDARQLLELREVADRIYLDTKLKGYLLDLIQATRDPRGAGMTDLAPLLAFGASPRATLHLARAAKGAALLSGRGFVMPEDIKSVAPDVLRHRLVPSYEAEAQGLDSDALISRLLERLPVP